MTNIKAGPITRLKPHQPAWRRILAPLFRPAKERSFEVTGLTETTLTIAPRLGR